MINRIWVDSPLVSLKERKIDENGLFVDNCMEKAMITDLANLSDSQIILMENKELRFDLKFNYIDYNKVGNSKVGFFPK